VADLARGLDRDVFRPMVCCLNFKGGLAEDLEREGIPVFTLDKKPKLDLAALVRLTRLMRRERVEVVHTHLWTASLWGRLAAVLARVPIKVVTEHNIDTWRRGWHFLADRVLARFTDHFIFVSREVESFYRRRLSLPEDRCQVVHNGIDVKPLLETIDRSRVREQMGLPVAATVAGVIGRLDERKGHRYFLEAMKKLALQEPQLYGLVVGEGRERDALLAQRAALGLQERVPIVGYWPSLPEALAAIDVFVLPSLMEGHPLAILEAMAASKPVVATSVGGNGEAVQHGRTGLLVPARDPDALGQAIGALVRGKESARRMGEEGRRSLGERFSLEAALRANQAVYLLCVERKRRGGPNGR
jgi:glycosyltransferase involved in cell wall biosynthesis